MLRSSLPVIAVTAVRTGCGKSAVARLLSRRLRDRGKRVAVLRHPMPYGDLAAERVQRFATRADLDSAALHGRGARGIRAASRAREHRFRRRRLRRHPSRRRDGSRHHPLGRRQQRFSLHPPRPAHRARRCAAAASDRDASSRRGGAAHGGYSGREQGRCRAGGRYAARDRRAEARQSARARSSSRRRRCGSTTPLR